MTAAKRGTAEDFFYRRGAQCAPMSRHIRSVGYCSATQAVYSAQARHTRVAQLVSLEIMDGTYESIYLVAFILAGPVYNNALTNCATRSCCALRRVARMCSRTVSDPANRFRKTRKKKSSAVPLFRSGHMSAICARLGSKGKVGVQRGRETAGVPSFLPPPRTRQSPALRRAQLLR